MTFSLQSTSCLLKLPTDTASQTANWPRLNVKNHMTRHRRSALYGAGIIAAYFLLIFKVKLEECFAWLSSWKNAPTHTIAGVQELYQQLLPTKVYYNRKTKSQVTDEKCRLCGDSLENVQHILSGSSALAQTKYLLRHNNAFKILFFEVLRSLDLMTKVEPWFSQVTPKPLYENEHATAFWDVPLFADPTQVKANRIDATVIDKTSKQVRVIEMSCPWLENRESKDFEKTTKYSQLRLELTNRYPEYKVNQYNIIMDVFNL